MLDAHLTHICVPTFSQLFLVHASGAKSKRAMEFMHISKSGGTSMCHTAGERLQRTIKI